MHDLSTRREPTHILTIKIPLFLDTPLINASGAVSDAIKICLSLSKAAFMGAVCDTPDVELTEVD